MDRDDRAQGGPNDGGFSSLKTLAICAASVGCVSLVLLFGSWLATMLPIAIEVAGNAMVLASNILAQRLSVGPWGLSALLSMFSWIAVCFGIKAAYHERNALAIAACVVASLLMVVWLVGWRAVDAPFIPTDNGVAPSVLITVAIVANSAFAILVAAFTSVLVWLGRIME